MKFKFLFKVDINNVISVEISDLNNENKEIIIIQNEKSFIKLYFQFRFK